MSQEQTTRRETNTFPRRPAPAESGVNKWMMDVYDTLARSSPQATIPRDYKRFVLWRGTYEEDSAYAVGDMTKVKTLKSYTSGSSTYNSLPGIYMCIQDIPANVEMDGITDAQTIELVNTYKREETAMVHPVYPEAENQYWQLIAFLPTLVTICEDNESKEYYVNAQPVTGSA